MSWEDITNFIDPKLMIVVVTCWVIGYMLKQTPAVPDWTIVYAVTAVAIASSGLILGFTVQSVLQGILCGAFSVYGSQLVKQTFLKRKD
ncbi:phage holin family protein [Paenibacillus glycanilyticus]|uniref:phage holin family protein n=1 Tax=Paenibacillus glycanilyticus TaxID=126569 RepID=UPI0024E18FBE|nr:phage holin family protein [Paenibacillus glycanilyticus]